LIDFSTVNASDWIALYGAVLSTLIAITALAKYFHLNWRLNKERSKLEISLYFLRKVDRTTKEVHPIVVVLLANLSSTRFSIKSLEYEGITQNGQKVTGSMGWYEQPEELYGIRNRLLPVALESGQTADLPMVEIGILTRIKN
jgi:hypothetical protein